MRKLKRLLVGLFLGANIASLILLWTCCLSTVISPAEHPRLALLGLIFPVFLLINLCFCFFWLVFKVRLTLVPLVGMLLVGGYILDYCPIHMQTSGTDSTLCVISFNAGSIAGEDKYQKLTQYIKAMSPDILCLQEISAAWANRKEVKQMLDSMHYTCAGGKEYFILSRLPALSDTIRISYPSKQGEYSIARWFAFGSDSLLVVNNHLESNHLSHEEKSEYRDVLRDPHHENLRSEGLFLTEKLGTAVRARAKQVQTLCQWIDSLNARSLIVCGDFNDTPISYTYQQLARRLKSAYRESGNGFGRSFNQAGFYVRIDHIFYSADWTSTHTYIDRQMDLSDHYPVVTRLRRR